MNFFTYLCETLLKNKRKKKEIVLMSDFNVDLLKCEDDANTADFLDKINSTSLIPQIPSPTRIKLWSKTLISNILSADAYAEAHLHLTH